MKNMKKVCSEGAADEREQDEDDGQESIDRCT